MIFNVYDRKNTERLLGTLKAALGSPNIGIYRVPMMPAPRKIDWDNIDYDPNEVPHTQTIITFHLEWRSESYETPSPSRFQREITRKEWVVFETEAPLASLMEVRTFTPDGADAFRSRIMRGHY